MNDAQKKLLAIGVFTALFKGFSVLYFLFLPILFAQNIITAFELGYIGALLVAGILCSTIIISHLPHRWSKVNLIKMALICLTVSTMMLFWSTDRVILCIAYTLIGLSTGLGLTIATELAAITTTQGKRFKAFASMSMLMDILRISYPIIVGIIFSRYNFSGVIIFALTMVVITSLLVFVLSKKWNLLEDAIDEVRSVELPFGLLKRNKRFAFTIIIEAIDCFSSSQLFVFLPTLLLFKNISIESTFALQSTVFLGYLSGRWIVSHLARQLNGFKAVALAEIGMIFTIILLIFISSSSLLYVLCFLLGLFTRGTSPVIKALVFDQVEAKQTRQASAIFMFFGDSGSAAGQLVFGLLLGWLGVVAPFAGAAIGAGIVAVVCLKHIHTVK